ncbi:MAG: proline dehydrogenase family protein [Acidobacteriota bacterium]
MNPALVNLMPDPFVRLFAGPYISGDSIAVAVETARELQTTRRIASSLDLLGEEAASVDQIDRAMAIYRDLIDAVAKDPAFEATRRRPTVSLKPSTFTLPRRDQKGDLSADTDLVRCYENIERIASYAKDRGVRLTIDMEDHAWVDFTLESYGKLLDRGFDNVGTVLQSMLHRTKEDVKRLDGRARIRLVIGIYREPAEIAYTQKRDMKKRLLEYAEALLDRGVYVELATHDEEYVFRFMKEVVAERGVRPDRFEVQMLLGVPRKTTQDDLVAGRYVDRPEMAGNGTIPADALAELRKGVLVRLYVPFAMQWSEALAYCRRRLNENPNIVWYGLKNLVVGT